MDEKIENNVELSRSEVKFLNLAIMERKNYVQEFIIDRIIEFRQKGMLWKEIALKLNLHEGQVHNISTRTWFPKSKDKENDIFGRLIGKIS